MIGQRDVVVHRNNDGADRWIVHRRESQCGQIGAGLLPRASTSSLSELDGPVAPGHYFTSPARCQPMAKVVVASHRSRSEYRMDLAPTEARQTRLRCGSARKDVDQFSDDSSGFAFHERKVMRKAIEPRRWDVQAE